MSDDITTLSLPELRRELCEAQIELRQRQARTGYLRAEAERDIIDRAGGDEKALGTNEAARQRALTLALEKNPFADWLLVLGDQQDRVRRLETELEICLDERVGDQWDIRDRLAAALEAQNISSVGDQTEGDPMWNMVTGGEMPPTTSSTAGAERRQHSRDRM